MTLYLYLTLIFSQISCLKLPLYNFNHDALPLALNPFITDKVTAAKKGYYNNGIGNPNATAESLGVAKYKNFTIDQTFKAINGPN